jgi:hypothetical protein
MLIFSENEYENLRKDTSEIRGCITNYIGFIITITGFSGFAKYLINDNNNAIALLLLLAIVILIITLLFEIIWYKFKSHNRFVGYMELLMQEQDVIFRDKLDDNSLSTKRYVTTYKEFIASDKELPKNIPTWEYIMSRLNNTFFQKYNYNEKQKLDSLIDTTENSRFVFAIPDKYHGLIDIEHKDSEFFKKIIWNLYGDKIKPSFFTLIKRFIFSFIYLFNSKSKRIIDDCYIDKRYMVSGWEYPKKITQIAFCAITLLFFYFIYILGTNYNLNFATEIFSLKGEKGFAIILTVFATLTYFIWIFKYAAGLKKLIYGIYSIESYCWNFFVFRIQLLNSKGLIPVYFSRSFLRFFKTQVLVEYLDKINFYKIIKEKKINVLPGEIGDYLKKLKNFSEFNKIERDVIHKFAVENFNAFTENRSLKENKIHTHKPNKRYNRINYLIKPFLNK